MVSLSGMSKKSTGHGSSSTCVMWVQGLCVKPCVCVCVCDVGACVCDVGAKLQMNNTHTCTVMQHRYFITKLFQHVSHGQWFACQHVLTHGACVCVHVVSTIC